MNKSALNQVNPQAPGRPFPFLEPGDPDSPERESLTLRGVASLLNMSVDWATKNRFRVKGHFRAGRAHRYDRETLVKARLSGQVLEEKRKPASLGLKRKRR